MKKIDAHLHVWSDDPSRYPYAPGRGEPRARGNAEFLLELMDASGIDGAVIVQPIYHGFDHRYVTDTVARWPDRFVGVALANPQAADPASELRRYLDQGYRGVRLNPRLWPNGHRMDDEVGRALMVLCAERRVPASFLIEPEHFEQVEALCAAFPDAPAIIDHFGRVRPTEEGRADVERLVGMSRLPNLYVKISGFPVSSSEDWPYRDMSGIVRRLIDAYSARRLMFATDFPHIVSQCGYAKGWQVAERLDPPLSSEERKWILGRTAQDLFNHWKG